MARVAREARDSGGVCDGVRHMAPMMHPPPSPREHRAVPDDATRITVHRPRPAVTLSRAIADALLRDAAALGAHWESQSRAVAPRPPGEPSAAATAGRGERIVCAVAGALADGVAGHQELVKAGWDLGAASHGSELSLHYLLKELNLLTAILLYASEQVLAGTDVAAEADAASAAAGMAAARRVQRTVSVLTLAASKGFTAGYLAGLRDEYRLLRHDLRNPLGTIRSAITFMEDESIAPERRNDPRYRRMVARNAVSLDRLIGHRLAEARTQGPALARQDVSLHELARAVRRDLRDDADERGCEIVVDEALPVREIDPIGAELALHALIAAALGLAAPGARVLVRAEAPTGPNPLVAIVLEGPRREGARVGPIGRDLAASVEQWGGGRVTGTCVDARLEIPAVDVLDDVVRDDAPAEDRAAGGSSAGGAGGDQRQDVAGAR